MPTPVEVVLATPYAAPAIPNAVKMVIESVELRITARQVAADGSTTSPSYTWQEDVTSDALLRARALADARAAMPTRFPS